MEKKTQKGRGLRRKVYANLLVRIIGQDIFLNTTFDGIHVVTVLFDVNLEGSTTKQNKKTLQKNGQKKKKKKQSVNHEQMKRHEITDKSFTIFSLSLSLSLVVNCTKLSTMGSVCVMRERPLMCYFDLFFFFNLD